MEQVLATISAGHQKAAWGVAGVDTGTQVKNNGSHNRISGQEGYEATLKGPSDPSSALVFSTYFSGGL